MELNHLKYDHPLHSQLEELYFSTKETINYMDEIWNNKRTLSCKTLQKLMNANPKQAQEEIF